jgi:hypothetical protein
VLSALEALHQSWQAGLTPEPAGAKTKEAPFLVPKMGLKIKFSEQSDPQSENENNEKLETRVPGSVSF